MMHPALAHLKVDTFADRATWLANRAASDTIGASEGPMALGVSPWGTPWTLWESKRKTAGEKRSDVLQRGHKWESAVVAEYGDESGRETLTPEQALGLPAGTIAILSHPEHPWLRETPDAFAFDRLDGFGQVEAKTAVRAHVWAPEGGVTIESWRDEYAELVPPHYAVQGYIQLAVTRLPWVDLCALVPKAGWLGVRWVRLLRDDETQGQIVHELGQWRERHLVNGEPPPLDGSQACNRYLARRFPVGKVKPMRTATDEEVALMRDLYATRLVHRATEKKARSLSNRLLALAEGHRLRVPEYGKRGPFGQPQASKGRVTVDLAELRAAAPDLVAKAEREGDGFATFNLYRFDELED